jgi:hypothetical protein
MTAPNRALLEVLLATQATQGLGSAELAQLDAQLAAYPDEDPEAFELAAAALHMALIEPVEELPDSLAERLESAAAAFTPEPTTAPAQPRPRERRRGRGRRRSGFAMWAGWAVAASFLGLLIYGSWIREPRVVVNPPPPVPTLADKRKNLEQDHEARPATFADKKGNASGTVVWSDRKQEGYLEIRGLPVNDPKTARYQIWIVDETRGKTAEPISGGLFDVRPDGTALVPVNAAIPIGDAAMFAVTKEIPNGVMVSKGPMLLVMTPKAG